MHFKALFSIIFRAFVGEELGRDDESITAEDFIWYTNRLRRAEERDGVADTVRCIFDILFRNPPKNHEVADFVGYWIIRATPLIAMIYEDCKCINKKFKFSENDFDPYNIRFDYWKKRSREEPFHPSSFTVQEIKSVLLQYNNPLNPVTTITYRTKRRTSEPEYGMLPAPTRNRKKYEPQDEHMGAGPRMQSAQGFWDEECQQAEENACCVASKEQFNDYQPQTNEKSYDVGCSQNEKNRFVAGEAVNVLTGGEPYLAGYISKICGNDIYIKFPGGRYEIYEYKYPPHAILKFRTQFPNGKYSPLIVRPNKPGHRQKIKKYETRIQEYFNK
ncbi:zinc finger protein 431-like [Aphis craccivora]|uniref:Zinc finger protein 431-like n=1 Tax=Aphis craccivora TaxID=307492 RepID=A0A6G0VR16_APHCR|nr:zinc finger protein 431-like [Aphis craccivora]